MTKRKKRCLSAVAALWVAASIQLALPHAAAASTVDNCPATGQFCVPQDDCPDDEDLIFMCQVQYGCMRDADLTITCWDSSTDFANWNCGLGQTFITCNWYNQP